jgi:hypothetical protein
MVTCKDGGKVATASDAKLTVGPTRDPVLVLSSIDGKSFQTQSPCPVPDDPNTSTTHCTQVSAVTGGASSKLAVGGEPVVLATLTATTNGTPPLPPGTQPLAPADAAQTKLRAT